MTVRGFGNTEILQIVEAVAREKSIPKEMILEALEDAIKFAARRKYGYEQHVKANIDRKTGEINLYRERLVVEDGEDLSQNNSKITLSEAQLKEPTALAGDILYEPLPPLDIGRIAAQSAKQIITTRVREIERTLQYEEFKNRIGEIINGVVEKIEYGNVIVKIGNAEAILRREFTLKADRYKQGDRIRAYLFTLDPNSKGPQIILSRTHNEFLAKLFQQEVPEIYENIIQIKSVVRDPGSRAKVAVFSPDSAIDPIGSCVGIRGSRVQAIISELKGEKIDIIQWSSNPATLAVNALAPAAISKVIIDEDKKRIEVVVPEDQQSITIGRQGQNVRLASDLLGWKIDILTEDKESKRRQDEFNSITQKFMVALDLEEILAQLLASEGFTSIEELAHTKVSEFSNIQGLDSSVAEELIARANEYITKYSDANETITISENEAEVYVNTLTAISTISKELANLLISKDIKTLEELADLSRDDFIELVPNNNLDITEIDAIIMEARKRVFI